MKQTDIDRLKAICEKEGFHFDWDHVDHSAIIIREKKDPWEGVEFIQATDTGIIVKVLSFDGETFTYHLRNNNREGEIFKFEQSFFKPSTESAYVEQLKKEAFERFGEIKDGDRFENPIFQVHNQISIAINNKFEYSKNSDMMWIGGVLIYQSGKWAKKLPERVKVEYTDSCSKSHNSKETRHEYRFLVSGRVGIELGTGDLLAKTLEDYLNKEAGN